MSKYPNLTKLPLVDTIVEIRFDAQMPSQVLAGLLFNKLQDHGYSGFQELPIMQLPESVREEDPSLRFNVNYRIMKENFWVGVGKRVLTVSNVLSSGSTYAGWNGYKQEIEIVLSLFKDLLPVVRLERVGVRYINMFNREDILEDIKLEITTPWQDNLTSEFSIGFVRKDDGINSRVQLVYPATMNFESDLTSRTGQLLDIDSYVDTITEQASVVDKIELLHGKTEETFFGLLKPDLVQELK